MTKRLLNRMLEFFVGFFLVISQENNPRKALDPFIGV